MVLKPAENVLRDLAKSSNVSLHSNSRLVGAVQNAVDADDKKRAKDAEEKGAKDEGYALRRKPELQSMHALGDESAPLTPWEVLHVLGRATALSRRGAARGLAEHWGALKYSQALIGDTGTFMKLSAEGKEATAEHYKANQSSELGVGFALALARRVLEGRYPDRVVSIVPADTALRAGWALTSKEKGTPPNYQYRPQFFAELWKPDEPSLVLPIACKGNHSNAAASHVQLAAASAHVEGVHIGAWNETPALIFSTELPRDGYVTVHALEAEGNGGWLNSPKSGSGGLDAQLSDVNHFPQIPLPAKGDEPPSTVPGLHVKREHYPWFRQVLARTAAAGLTAFAGDGEATAQYLTERQGRKRFTGVGHAATESMQDAWHDLFGIRFHGTDHVFRLNGTRVEAFSGVAHDLLDLLVDGRVEQYRHEIYKRRSNWPNGSWDSSWGGPVSVHPDGTVLAMRLLPERDDSICTRCQ